MLQTVSELIINNKEEEFNRSSLSAMFKKMTSLTTCIWNPFLSSFSTFRQIFPNCESDILKRTRPRISMFCSPPSLPPTSVIFSSTFTWTLKKYTTSCVDTINKSSSFRTVIQVVSDALFFHLSYSTVYTAAKCEIKKFRIWPRKNRATKVFILLNCFFFPFHLHINFITNTLIEIEIHKVADTNKNLVEHKHPQNHLRNC